MNIGDTVSFQIIERCWRPFQQWGIAIAAVAYAVRAPLGFSFDVPTFIALASFGTGQMAIRGLEKFGKQKMENE